MNNMLCYHLSALRCARRMVCKIPGRRHMSKHSRQSDLNRCRDNAYELARLATKAQLILEELHRKIDLRVHTDNRGDENPRPSKKRPRRAPSEDQEDADARAPSSVDVESPPSEEEIYNKYQEIKADIKKNMKYITNKNLQKQALLDWIYDETGNHIVVLNRRDTSVGWLLGRLADAKLQKFYNW